jgi:DMSO/TMAO reductase YedYZ molybdopterin-dependent catalytic subunit
MTAKLPPGQRAIDHFPRFGVLAYAGRLPKMPGVPELQLAKDESSSSLRAEDFGELQRKELVADFHCVTSWSRCGLRWSGYPFKDIYERLIVPRVRPEADDRFVELTALDGYRTSVLLADLLQENVVLADRLDGEPLSLEHGAPFRLVVPDLYAYKSVKHVSRIRLRKDFRRGLADRQTLAHPRGRVALEERGRGLPGPIYRVVYRALIPATLWYYRRFGTRAASQE